MTMPYRMKLRKWQVILRPSPPRHSAESRSCYTSLPATPYPGYLFAEAREIAELAEAAGWQLIDTEQGERTRLGAAFNLSFLAEISSPVSRV